MTTNERPLWHKRLPKWEMADEIRIRIVPRFKTSGMSGDEWRHHAQVDFLFKGRVVGEAAFRDIEAAIMGLGGAWHRLSDGGFPDSVVHLDDTKCDQPSCRNDAVARFALKRLTANDGSWLDPAEAADARYFRKFCTVHLRRGDCSREDCDSNMEPLDGITADASTNTQESPAAFGGAIVLDGEV